MRNNKTTHIGHFFPQKNYMWYFTIFLVDCEWAEWVLGECSEECGGGIQIDTRQPLQEAQFGGNACEGESSRQKECNPDPCPGN